MPKLKLLCDSCDAEFTVSFSKGYDVDYCPCCGAGIDKDWNSSDEPEEE